MNQDMSVEVTPDFVGGMCLLYVGTIFAVSYRETGLLRVSQFVAPTDASGLGRKLNFPFLRPSRL